VIITVGLLVLLVVPTLVWLTVRYWPKDRGQAAERGQVGAGKPAVKHRWWQP
jgi:hypothetical protein